MSFIMREHMRKQRGCCGNSAADSDFVITTWIVQFLYFLNPKFQASCHLLELYSLVSVIPHWKPQRQVFSQCCSYKFQILSPSKQGRQISRSCLQLMKVKYSIHIVHLVTYCNTEAKNKMSLVMRKPVFGVSDLVRHKSGCTTTQDG